MCLVALTIHALATLPISAAEDSSGGKIDFNRDIRPILSDKCFQCHGPDEETQEADLRLDIREAALAHGPPAAIVPGDPGASEILHRVTADDPDDRMPPAKINKPVSPEEADLLRRWIEQGAEYRGHWSFQPVQKADAPAVEDEDWPVNGIDRFVLAKLESEKVRPSPEADPRTLARRLSLDLTGLLPAPGRVESFVEAHAENPDAAVGEFVDALLADPAHGERWARHWLDQARYADSHGYTIDGPRTMWPYRDWVISAINEDLPFDRFTVEQLAGDLLDNPSRAQLVATGFHRNTLINQEGGTDDEQFRYEEMVDRVNTTGAVWMGLTLGCAQCHTHKFDPITHREYFELYAFFNQGVDVNNTGATLAVAEGELFLDEPGSEKMLQTYRSVAEALETLEKNKEKRQAAWEKRTLAELQSGGDENPGARWAKVRPGKHNAREAELALLDDLSLLAGPGHPNERYSIELPLTTSAGDPDATGGSNASGDAEAHGTKIAALRLRLLTHTSLPKNGPGMAANGNFILTEIEIRQGGEPVPVARAQADHAQPGYPVSSAIDGKTDTGWAISTGKGSAPGAKRNAPHEAHFLFAEPVDPADGLLEVVLRHDRNQNYTLGRFAFDLSPSAPRDLGTNRLREVLETPDKKRSDADKKFLAREFDARDEEGRRARTAVREAKGALGLGPEVETMIMRDLPREEHRETFLHVRGDFVRPDRELGPLQPGVPAVFPEMAKADRPGERNRLDLARWLVRPDHPLTARVTVNRVWMRYFGKGLVETENDFGTQGSYPTHPGLLDWLAARFVEDGWSMKKLHRLIATSATYRQASHHRDDLATKDPLNHLLARQVRLRFDAEIVRDAALGASGLLVREIGGPGIRPPQPAGVYSFTQRKQRWKAAEGPDRYRRGVYIHFIRSAPYPLLTTFDSPDFQSTCTARSRSNTPLQSLALANDEALFELARGLAARLLREVPGRGSVATRRRIDRAFALCYSRPPSENERETLVAFVKRQERAWEDQPDAARAVAPSDDLAGTVAASLGMEEKKDKAGREESFSPAEAASWTALARTLMNTDEFIVRE